MRSVGGAAREGLRRATAAPTLWLWLWLANVLVALPAAWAVTASIQDSIGSSLANETMREGFDMTWYGEYREEARGLERTFGPEVTGAGPFYGNLEGWVTGGMFRGPAELVGLGLLYALLWTFLTGGVLEWLRDTSGKFSAGRLLENGGRFFFRFVRLGLLSAVLYFLVFRFHGWVFSRLDQALRDVTSERTVLLASLLGYLLTAVLLLLVHTCFDYAKIATVTEERRSMLVAALRGVGFVLLHPARTLGLVGLWVLASGVLLLIYAGLAPGATQSTALAIGLAFVVGQLFVVLKLIARLWLYAGQVAMWRALIDGPAVASAPAGTGPAVSDLS